MPSVVASLLNALSEVPSLVCRPMFGGYGLYSGGHFFGIIWDNHVFFFTDEKSRKKYIEAGMGPFVIREGQKVGNYFEVPKKVLKDEATATKWAKEAVECRKRFPVKRAKKKREHR